MFPGWMRSKSGTEASLLDGRDSSAGPGLLPERPPLAWDITPLPVLRGRDTQKGRPAGTSASTNLCFYFVNMFICIWLQKTKSKHFIISCGLEPF